MRKFILIMTALFLLSATGLAEIIDSGTTGDCTWTLSDDGTLTFSGTGAIPDYSTLDYAPWLFYNSSITTVVIGDGVTSIGDWAFYYCSGLTSVTIGNSVTSIGYGAFIGCEKLTSVTIPESVISIGDWAFHYCRGLTSVTIPNSVTSIGDSAFSSCSGLTSVTIGNSVTSIGYGAFSSCSGLTSVTIGNSVISIGDGAFNDCISLTSVTIGNNVTSIGNRAFSYCSGLTSVTIPNSVTSIGESAFSWCRGLTSVTIGNSVTSIGDGAFNDCISLTSVTNLNPVPQSINSYVFYYVFLSNVTLYVPSESIEDYTAAAIWKDFKEIKAYIPSAIESPAVGSSINVYPNPVTESFRINGITAPTEVTVTDLSGRIVLQQTVEAGESVAVGNLPKGIYLVCAGDKTLKVVKR
ncbi:MAG: leucine-rich repeat protein [Dysgonamonadaceae bacterium]|jgi:hypothetical protein|nr:leucine-rich repeat protein [Dysgonamonadaceae bacterium]